MSAREFELTFRSNSVPFWGMFFSLFVSLGMELPSLRKTTIELIPGNFPTVSAIAEGEADMGIITPPVCATMAYRGVGPYNKKMENLRAIGSFPHDDRMMWAVPADSGINSIEEMKDKPLRLAIPDTTCPVRFVVEKILEAYDTSLDDLKSHGWQILEEEHPFRCMELAIQGKADALIHEGRKTPPWIKLTQSRLMKFLPIREDVLQKMADEYGYRKAVLSKGMLRGVDGEVPCIDFSDWLMFVRNDMPDDLAYRITRIFIERREDFEVSFRRLPPEKSDLVYPIDPKQVWRNVGEIPLHPGAERYYKEHGHM